VTHTLFIFSARLRKPLTHINDKRRITQALLKMQFFGLFLSVLAFASLLKCALGQDVSIQTSFIFTNSQCNSEQEKTVRQALSDALILANAALDDSGELLSDSGGNHKYVNFDSEAAIE
jgi:hypothetical protein